MNYISSTHQDKEAMLREIGVAGFNDLISNIPSSLKNFELSIPLGISELELDRQMDEAGRLNKNFKYNISFLGGGNYDHFIPAAIDRIALRGEFITAYTPYQGEASQGTLQSMYEYQSLICELTGMDVSNASMYDGASSVAEAAILAIRSTERKKILVLESVHPEYRNVVRTYLSHMGCDVVVVNLKDGAVDFEALKAKIDDHTAAVIFQQPNFFGILEPAEALCELAHSKGALAIAAVNPVTLGILQPPGEYGADIAVGEGQSLGNPVSFGGPHFGFFTVKDDLLRKIPGRISGMTVDKMGRRAFVLTLQAREQHIRREKATSNICTNQALCALKSAIYLSLLGRAGIKKLSLLNLSKAHQAYERLLKVRGVAAYSEKPFFNEFVIKIDRNKEKFKENLRKYGIIGPLDLAAFYPEMNSHYLVAVTEKRTSQDVEVLARAIEETA